ncbi:MAG TPA: DUF4936 family protein [Ideonella sp.]|nr:DUF4936 family protein [Ideonella sp.]
MQTDPGRQGPGTGGRWWFVYYRVPADKLADAVQAARIAQQTLIGAHAGLSASLMQRPQPDADRLVTVMETYRVGPEWPADRLSGVPDAIEQAVGAVVARWLQGPRHLEVFEPCA